MPKDIRVLKNFCPHTKEKWCFHMATTLRVLRDHSGKGGCPYPRGNKRISDQFRKLKRVWAAWKRHVCSFVDMPDTLCRQIRAVDQSFVFLYGKQIQKRLARPMYWRDVAIIYKALRKLQRRAAADSRSYMKVNEKVFWNYIFLTL